MPDHSNFPAIYDVTKPDTADRSHEERAALRATLWRHEQGQLSKEETVVVLEALGLIDPQPADTMCPPLTRAQRATAARRASMARTRAAQAAKRENGEGAA